MTPIDPDGEGGEGTATSREIHHLHELTALLVRHGWPIWRVARKAGLSLHTLRTWMSKDPLTRGEARYQSYTTRHLVRLQARYRAGLEREDTKRTMIADRLRRITEELDRRAPVAAEDSSAIGDRGGERTDDQA